MSKYFVFKGDDQPYHRAYGTHNYIEPASDDPRCIWQGDSYKEALQIAKEANKKHRKAITQQKWWDKAVSQSTSGDKNKP